jgi:putative ABC transport system ATP-binding protein
MLETRDLRKTYARGSQRVEALRGISLTVARGEIVAIVGASGSGKSTLLHLCGALDRPTAGSVLLGGRPVESLSDDALSAFRRRHLGFVFQFFNLVPTLSAEENVALPLLLDGQPLARVTPRARELLEAVGLGGRARHRPHELSGGEMQRVAIARALVGDPLLVLADEPTGNLDSVAGERVLRLLHDTLRRRGLTLLMVTHDARAAAAADRIITLRDGQVEADTGLRHRDSDALAHKEAL